MVRPAGARQQPPAMQTRCGKLPTLPRSASRLPDGHAPLAEVAARSPLFASDEDLEKWQASNPGVDGMGLPADLMLWVGMSAAQELAGELKESSQDAAIRIYQSV